MEKHTYQTGIIGNCSYLAHVNKNTNIDWLCWPRFDSSFVFGKMLDENKGGEFSILPVGEYTSSQFYLENTNVICTDITCETGKYRITDFAPRFKQYDRFFKPLMLVRKLELMEGAPRVNVKCEPMAGYGARKLNSVRGSNHIEYYGSEETLRLTTDIPISYLSDDRYFVLSESKYLVLTYGHPLEAPLVSTAENFCVKRSVIGVSGSNTQP